jgi:DNA replication protein DnaC
MDEITVLGVKIRRSPVSCVSKPDCEYHRRGFCRECTCDKCVGGFLIEEWREALRRGEQTGPRECDCVKAARSRKRLRDAGLERLAERCTFDSFLTDKPWQEAMKKAAQDYLAVCREQSFFLSGQSGCGKTHLCTALCNEIIRRGGSLRYFRWVKDGTRLKQLVTERDGGYDKEIAALIKTPYLYIDDLFKQELTAADIRLAYEILGGRCNKGRPVILSSERSLEYIRAARGGDGEAVAGRIFESCGRGKYCLELSGAEKNMRFQGA